MIKDFPPPHPRTGFAVRRLDLPHGLDFLSLVLSGHEFPWHLHEGYTVGLVVSGSLEYRCLGEMHHFEPGSLFLRKPGEVHTERAVPGSGPTRYHVIYPRVELVQSLIGQAPLVQECSTTNPGVVGQFRQLALIAACGNASTADRALKATLTLVFQSLGGPAGVVGESRRRELTDVVRSFLLRNLERRPSVDDLAPKLGLHPAYLRRVFAEETGLSPRSYLLQLRVMRARQLLGRGEPIARVVTAAGFTDQAHLTHEFKRTMGYSPRRFQKELGYR